MSILPVFTSLPKSLKRAFHLLMREGETQMIIAQFVLLMILWLKVFSSGLKIKTGCQLFDLCQSLLILAIRKCLHTNIDEKEGAENVFSFFLSQK